MAVTEQKRANPERVPSAVAVTVVHNQARTCCHARGLGVPPWAESSCARDLAMRRLSMLTSTTSPSFALVLRSNGSTAYIISVKADDVQESTRRYEKGRGRFGGKSESRVSAKATEQTGS